MKERYGWIDIAKGICLLAVIIGHMGLEFTGFVYSFHLTTFFILSGYTLRKADLNAEYLAQKFRRLMVPYFITCAAVVGMDAVNAVFIDKMVSNQSVTQVLYKGIVKTFFASGSRTNLGSIEMGRSIGAIWFLPAMFFALIFVQLILRLKSNKAQAFVSLGLFGFAVATAGIFWLPFSVQSAMLATPFILIGKWLKDYEILEKLKIWHYLILLAIFLVGCYFGVAQAFYMVGGVLKDAFFTPLCALCSSLCVIGLSRLIKKLPPIEYIGKNSLIFLCVHLFEMNTITPYFRKLRNLLNIPHTFWPRFIMDMLVVVAVSVILIRFSSRTKNVSLKKTTRDPSIDIMRAFLIILMIVGHFAINEGFRRFIYSFHMMAFVMVSGYFYKSNIPLKENLKKTFKALSHYAIYCVMYWIVSLNPWTMKAEILLSGVSYVRKVLPDTLSVGPVYFILLLFVIRLIYVFVDLIRNEWLKNLAVLGVFFLGIMLGKYEYWLPWTFDGACFSLLFYHIAHYIRKYDLLRKSLSIPAIYFPLSCMWAYLIYWGGMEIAVRKYGNIGTTILGVVSAFFISFLLCHYLATHLPRWISSALAWVGQSTAYILMLHCLFGGRFQTFANEVLGFAYGNVFHMGFCVAAQVFTGTMVYVLIFYGKKLLSKIVKPKAMAAA